MLGLRKGRANGQGKVGLRKFKNVTLVSDDDGMILGLGYGANPLQPLSQSLVLTLPFTFDPEFDNRKEFVGKVLQPDFGIWS